MFLKRQGYFFLQHVIVNEYEREFRSFDLFIGSRLLFFFSKIRYRFLIEYQRHCPLIGSNGDGMMCQTRAVTVLIGINELFTIRELKIVEVCSRRVI